MLTILFKKRGPYIPPIIIPIPPVPQFHPPYIKGRLRIDDITLNTFIQQFLVNREIENVEIVDSYSDRDNLTIPSIAIDHKLTYYRPTDLSKKLKEGSSNLE